MVKNFIIILLLVTLIGVLVRVWYPSKGKDFVQKLDSVGIVVSGATVLDLSNKNLDKFPSYVLKMTDLQELNISHNNLTGALPAEIRFLQNLKILNASYNQMTGVPAEIGQLKNLEVLDFSNNQLTGLPYELANLKKLKVLNLSGNNYSTIDLEIIKKGLPSGVQIIL